MRTPPSTAAPINVLIVASWYPGVDDTARGRFVADQAEALAATGRARPLVVSFDPAHAERDFLARDHYLATVVDHRARALTSRSDSVSPRAWGSRGDIPVARPIVVEGPGNSASADAQGDLRRAALVDLVEALAPVDRGVVHAHTAYPDGYAAAAVARRLGWPLVVTEHATFVQRQLGRRAQRHGYLEAVETSSRFLAVSDALADELRASVPGIGEKLEVVHNAVAIDDFVPTGLEGRRLDELLFVGYRRERKGIVTLLQAFADVLDDRPAATLRLLGRSLTDAEEARWQELADDLGIAHAVSFEPPADRAGIAAAMARASLLVHASHRETFGITTIEALAAGLPVVAARAGGISDILEDSTLGELVPPQDSRYLSRAILRTLARRDEFDPARLRAAAEPYAASAVAARLLAIYGEVLSTAGVAATGPPPAPEGVPWVGLADSLESPLMVFGYDAARTAQQLAVLPSELRALMTVVVGSGDVSLLPDVATVVDARRDVQARLREVGLQGPRGSVSTRLRRLLGDPVGPIRRRLTAGGIYELRQRAVRSGVLAGVEASGTLHGGASPEAICLTAIDHLIAQPLIAAGRLRPAPGGILWLADRWRSLHPPVEDRPSRSRMVEASQSPTIGQ